MVALHSPGQVRRYENYLRIEHESSVFVFQERGGKPPRKRPAPQVREARAGDLIENPGWKVTVGKASHVQPLLECLAFRLDSDEGSMCYSGDSGGVCEEVIELARGCDVAIPMNHYLSGTEPTASYRAACGNHRDNAVIARRAGVKTLALTHVLAQIDRPGIREQIIREVKQEFDGQVIWGEDLMRLTLRKHSLVKIEQAGKTG
jgi:ribonuclease BN (tRNA processing enzyme)